MDARALDAAAGLCKLVKAPNLLAYLGLAEDASSGEARDKLQARRRYMQGMQANPKYKREALFLIKNYNTLARVLEDPRRHVSDMRRRTENEHLPVLEMTINGALSGGSITEDQVSYLQHNADELGVSEDTFVSMITRLADIQGVALPGQEPPAVTDDEHTDYFSILGVSHDATRTDVQMAYEERIRSIRDLRDPTRSASEQRRLDRAFAKLMAQDLLTGPPARRSVSSIDPNVYRAPTAPPARVRTHHPSGPMSSSPTSLPNLGQRPARLEILGDPERRVRLTGGPQSTTIEIRNGGDRSMAGTIRSDSPWLVVDPVTLDPDARDQTVRVTLLPDRMPHRTATGAVTVQTEKGERASIAFTAERRVVHPAVLAGIGSGVLLGLLVLAIIVLIGWGAPRGNDTTGTGGLTITVDPWATEILVDGRQVGSGRNAVLGSPPLGDVTVEARHPNFETVRQTVRVEPDKPIIVPLSLELATDLDYRPEPGQTKQRVEQEVTQRILREHSQEMEACIERRGRPGTPPDGVIRIYFDTTGRAAGVELEGTGMESPEVRACLERQAAAVMLPPLRSGDFATVLVELTPAAP